MRSLLVALLTSMTIVNSAQAEPATDTGGTFEITWPEKCESTSDANYAESVAPWNENLLCNVTRVETADFVNQSQEQVNEQVRDLFTEEHWRMMTKSVDIEEFTDRRVVEGEFVSQRVTALWLNGPKRMQIRMAVVPRPKDFFLIHCFSPEHSFEHWAPTFEAVLDSFKPL